MTIDELRYPLGKYYPPENITANQREEWLNTIIDLPTQMDAAAKNLNDEQLDCPYREGGWTVRQVVHHVADSHMNAYIRFKLAITEDNPTIKPYEEKDWAELNDSKNAPIENSLLIIKYLHRRWAQVIQQIKDAEWERTFYHPENKRTYTLAFALGLYAWHSQHHVAHITNLRKLKGW